MSMEDLIPEEEMVVTITRGGYVKRTRSDNYRTQHRGGKGVKGAQLRGDDVVEHFFVTTTHHWLLFFTNLGRVYRAKAYELEEAGRDAKGQHVANLLAFQPDEEIAQVWTCGTTSRHRTWCWPPSNGLVKKTRLEDYDTNRSAGVIAINLRDGDELVSAQLVSETDDLLLVSRKGQSIRFTATDEALRPMGRATSGVTGMKFREHGRTAGRRRRHRRGVRLHRHRGRLRQAHRGGGIPAAGPRRTGHQGGQAGRGPRRPGRGADRRGGRRGPGGHERRQGGTLCRGRGARQGPRHHGRHLRQAGQERPHHRGGPQQRTRPGQ